MKREVFYTFIALAELLAFLAAFGPPESRLGFGVFSVVSGAVAIGWASMPHDQ